MLPSAVYFHLAYAARHYGWLFFAAPGVFVQGNSRLETFIRKANSNAAEINYVMASISAFVYLTNPTRASAADPGTATFSPVATLLVIYSLTSLSHATIPRLATERSHLHLSTPASTQPTGNHQSTSSSCTAVTTVTRTNLHNTPRLQSPQSRLVPPQ